MVASVLLQVIQQAPGQTQSAKARCNVHPFDLAVFIAEELDATTTGRHAVLSNDKKSYALRQQLLDTVTMTAFLRVKRLQMSFEFRNHCLRVRRIRPAPQ